MGWKKLKEKYGSVFTIILKASKVLVFAAFIWTAVVMFNLGANRQDIINILYAAALFIILNKLDKNIE